MKNRLKLYFDQESNDAEFHDHDFGELGDLAKIVAILNKSLSPHVQAKMVGDKAVIKCKNKTVWIDSHCLVAGEASTQQ
jgi:hypothetical protein